jgi:protein-tyrosine phosphatase
VIDLHCHALPGIDDGPDDMQGSIALGRAAAETGTKPLVTTPRIDRRAPATGPRRPGGREAVPTGILESRPIPERPVEALNPRA